MDNKTTQQLATTAMPDDAKKHRRLERVNPKDHVRTEGEKKFDRLTYTTVGYIINALVSVVAVYWVERTHSGQSWLNNRIEWVKGTWPKIDADKAKMYTTKTFFLVGGFAVMLPMKWLEDAKVRLVKKWDRAIYGDKVDTDPMILQSHKDLEAAPKQNWGSILGSRVLALIPFYVLYGALWDNKSTLSKWTNPELRAMSKQEIKTAEELDPSAFAKKASKGFFFDHPITAAARYFGKKWAQLTGKTEMVARIEQVEKDFPGALTHPKFGSETTHDPNHTALPYYFVSEAITSGMVAWGVYVLTRILGPIIGKKAVKPGEAVEAAPQAGIGSAHAVAAATEKTAAPAVQELPVSQKHGTAAQIPAVEEKVEHPHAKEHPPQHHEKPQHEAAHHPAPRETPHDAVPPGHVKDHNDDAEKAPHMPEKKVHLAGIEHHNAAPQLAHEGVA